MQGTLLQILQYNVRKDKISTLISLLEDTRVHKFDIIAVQETQQNSFIKTDYCLTTAPFYIIYSFSNKTRVYFYIHKKIHFSKQTVTVSHKDIQSLVLHYKDKSQEKKLIIHNIYNLSLFFYFTIEEDTLNTLYNQLQQKVNGHIVIKDFNLHHLMWTDIFRFTQHKSTNILINII